MDSFEPDSGSPKHPTHGSMKSALLKESLQESLVYRLKGHLTPKSESNKFLISDSDFAEGLTDVSLVRKLAEHCY